MRYFIERTLKFIYSKRKQIIFALFAVVGFVLDKDNSLGVSKSVVSAVVGTAAVAGGTAAAGGTATAGGTAAGGTATAGGTTASSTGAKVSSSSVGTSINNSVPKNTNPKFNNSSTLSSGSVNQSDLKSPSSRLDESTSSASKKAASKSSVETETKDSKNSRLSPELNKKNKEDEDEDDGNLDDATKEITKSSGGAIVGCLFTSIILIIFAVPIMLLLLINPTSSVMSQIDCSVYNGSDCVEQSSTGGFLNKLKNLFSYGSFATNAEVVTEKITNVYEKIKEEGFTIDLPLLSSSMFMDSENLKTELDSNGQISITDDMMERLEYLEELARLQMIEDYVIYTCNVKVVDGETIYYKETNYEEIDPDTLEEGECDESTVGETFKEVDYHFDLEEYYIRLEESELLDLIYKDYVESDSIIISKIKNQYNLYNSLNLIRKDDEEYGNVPLTLLYDTNVNLQTPLKGWYYITSPFGMRDGEYAGMHTGIDLVANDKNIYSAGDGVVTRSNVETEGGNVVEITHTSSNGVSYVTQYAHLSQRLVSKGDIVKSGDIIGIMGDTGTLASGVHLHFSMWVKEPYELLNPKNLFSGASNY